MGIQSAMFSGVSGLNSNSQAMSVIGNNLANTNTVGFKSSRVLFSDLLSSNVAGSGGNSQVGRGVGLSTVDNVLSQGTFQTTSSGTDVAIEGSGFFILKEPSDNTPYYSRAGAFHFDGTGNLVNPEGLIVQGKLFDPVNNDKLLPTDPTNIQVANVGLIAASPTSTLTFTTNLNEKSALLDVGTKVATASLAPSSATAMTTLTINGTPIGSVAPPSTTAAKVTAINLLSTTTGVTATQSGTSQTYAAPTAFGATIASGDITINGTPIGAVDTTGTDAATQAANVAAAINLQKGTTGVTATVSPTDVLILSNANGSAINVALAGGATAATAGLSDGIVAADTNNKITLTTTLGNTAGINLTGSSATDLTAIGFATAGPQTTIDTITNAQINPADDTTYNYSASSQIYDSLGQSHLVSVYWRLTDGATNTWNMGYTVDNNNAALTMVTDPTTGTVKNLTFDAKGNLADTNGDGIPDPVTVPVTLPSWTNGATTPQTINLSFDCTQYDSDSVVIGQTQNGYSAGSLTGVAINSSGIVVASYSNGKQINVAELALAKFQNPGGLKLAGANRYTAATADVGIIRVGIPGSELGKVFTNSLEQSNVDMGQEFVNMISTQRGFSANGKIITTVDEMLQELIGLKR